MRILHRATAISCRIYVPQRRYVLYVIPLLVSTTTLRQVRLPYASPQPNHHLVTLA